MSLGQRFYDLRPQIELVSLWAFSRVLVFALAGRYGSDIPLYQEFTMRLFEGQRPYLDYPLDHPPLALLTMALPAILAPFLDYAHGFRLLMLTCDLGILLLLARIVSGFPSYQTQRRGILLLYTWLGAITFPFLYERVDVALTFLLMLLVWAGLRARMGWGYLVLLLCLGYNFGTWMLWPFWLLTDRFLHGEWRRPLGRFAVGALLACSGIYVGLHALGTGFWSFLRYHWFKGLEIESISASPVLIAQMLGLQQSIDVSAGFARLTGKFPQTVAAALLSLEMALIGSMWAFVAWRLRKHEGLVTRERLLAWLLSGVLTHVLAFQLSSLIFLPQYILWIFPFACAALPIVQSGIWWTGLWIALPVYTVTVFPMNFQALLKLEGGPMIVLLIRNLTLVILCAWAISLWISRKSACAVSDTPVDPARHHSQSDPPC